MLISSPKRLEIFQLQCVTNEINSGEVKGQAGTHCTTALHSREKVVLLHAVLHPPFCNPDSDSLHL